VENPPTTAAALSPAARYRQEVLSPTSTESVSTGVHHAVLSPTRYVRLRHRRGDELLVAHFERDDTINGEKSKETQAKAEEQEESYRHMAST
jgi:hypothetical protein